jgi:hypothetical protein
MEVYLATKKVLRRRHEAIRFAERLMVYRNRTTEKICDPVGVVCGLLDTISIIEPPRGEGLAY